MFAIETLPIWLDARCFYVEFVRHFAQVAPEHLREVLEVMLSIYIVLFCDDRSSHAC